MKTFLPELDDWIKGQTERYYEERNEFNQNQKKREALVNSKDSSALQKSYAILGDLIKASNIERSSSELVTLSIIKILAVHVNATQNSLDDTIDQLVKAGIPEKTKDVESIKRLNEEVAKLKRMRAEWEPYFATLKEAIEKKKKLLKKYK